MKQFNLNLKFLIHEYNRGSRKIILEGGSRSGKTYSIIHFFIWLANRTNYGEPKFTVNILRSTYSSFKTSLYKDFNNIFPVFGIPSPFEGVRDIHSFWIFGCKFNLVGADKIRLDKFEGIGGDYTWFNEMLDIDHNIYKATVQRTERMIIGDFNPKYSDHWVFNSVLSLPDVSHLHTTMLDNPYIPALGKQQILSYDPSNPVNVTNGTADDYYWKVYGLGLRASPEGLVFPLVTYIERMPEGIERFIYGLDFGYTNDPTALVRIGVSGNNLYMEKLLYYPFDNAGSLAPFLLRLLPDQQHIWADSADPAMIADLRRMGLRVLAVNKFAGSIQFGIDVLKRYKLHIIQDQDFRREQENYKWREVNGIRLNEPVHQYNHCFDGNTMISTLRGQIKIKDVNNSDYVYTRFGINKVLRSFYNGCRPICKYSIKFINFTLRIRCTEDHEFLTEKGWQQISKIKPGETLYLLNYSMVKNTGYTKEKNIYQEGESDYISTFGSITMAKYLKDLMFITKTAINKIMSSVTSNLLKVQNTRDTIFSNDIKKIKNGRRDSLPPELKQQKNGINQRSVLNGINNTLKYFDLEASHLVSRIVKYAESSLQKEIPPIVFAQTRVNQSSEDYKRLTISHISALGVEKNLQGINTEKRPIIAGHVILRIDAVPEGIKPVYDLSISDKHEFFANNILVHNCWDSARYAAISELRPVS